MSTTAFSPGTRRTVPHKLSELGRIRIGDREPNASKPGTHPHKLDVFRLTSSNGSLLGFAAGLYGGTVCPWEGDGAPRDEYNRPMAFELYTSVNAMDILIPTMSAVSLSFERWSAAGCQQRCTGETITECPLTEALIGQPCTCPTDDLERAALAKRGTACARILRLNVLLPDLPGMGVWRLETKGYYATAELMGTLDMLQMAGQAHSIIEAVLRLEQRTLKRLGTGEGTGTLRFAVPVLWPKYTPRQLLAGSAQALLLPPPPLPVAEVVEELYGPVVDATACQPAVSHQAQFEAAITAQGGNVAANLEGWYGWAEKQLKVVREAFTTAHWARLLQAVRDAEELRAVPPPSPVQPDGPQQTADAIQSGWVVSGSGETPMPAPAPPGGLQEGIAWETLRAHRTNPRLPLELREQIQAALAGGSLTSETAAQTLARVVLDCLAAAEEETSS